MNSLPAAVDVCRSFLGVVGAISAAKAAAASSGASSTFVDDLVETLTRQIERVEEASWRLESAIDAAAPDPDRFKIALRRLATLKRVAVMLRSWTEQRCWEDDEGAVMAAPEQLISGLKRVAAWSGRVVEKRVLRIHEQSGSGAGVEPVGRDPFSLKDLEEEIREIERSGPRTEEDALEDGKEFQEMMNLMKGSATGLDGDHKRWLPPTVRD
ncbi:hypothetical protein J5N97_023663 [Dioscorea zingiberensis]|uniref:Uncharacterized protein n=1 Tax=Dioscorea zingiberensis TaxID=325984 RepID=A0A9D5C4Z1_9LILI|nr:hypothetical protein J5N97_023663 [Dioscorea zingiberensis]